MNKIKNPCEGCDSDGKMWQCKGLYRDSPNIWLLKNVGYNCSEYIEYQARLEQQRETVWEIVEWLRYEACWCESFELVSRLEQQLKEAGVIL